MGLDREGSAFLSERREIGLLRDEVFGGRDDSSLLVYLGDIKSLITDTTVASHIASTLTCPAPEWNFAYRIISGAPGDI